MHPNIGVEKYFFEAGDRILNRIKEQRDTYRCTARGFERRPRGLEAGWIDEPLWMLGPGPTY